jgi:hypothetical protein
VVLAEVISLRLGNVTLIHAHHRVLRFVLIYTRRIRLDPVAVAYIFLWLTALMVLSVFIFFRLDLKNSNLLVASIIVRFSIDHKMVTFTQVLHQTRVLSVMTNVRVRLLLLVDVEQRTVGGLNRNQEALVVLPLFATIRLFIKGKFLEIVVSYVCILSVTWVVSDFLFLTLEDFNQRVQLTLCFFELLFF